MMLYPDEFGRPLNSGAARLVIVHGDVIPAAYAKFHFAFTVKNVGEVDAEGVFFQATIWDEFFTGDPQLLYVRPSNPIRPEQLMDMRVEWLQPRVEVPTHFVKVLLSCGRDLAYGEWTHFFKWPGLKDGRYTPALEPLEAFDKALFEKRLSEWKRHKDFEDVP
jgi:hypothetical protein